MRSLLGSLWMLTFLWMVPLAFAQDGEESKAMILKRFVEEFIPLTPGEGKYPDAFVLGSDTGPTNERPPQRLTLKKPFALGKYEVTQELYQAIMGTSPSKWRGPRNSVEKINWNEAQEFCQKATTELRQRKLIQPNEIIRLPSEAEWEYACRAGTTGAYSFGDDVQLLTDYAWYKDNSKGHDPPVGMKKANPWGFYDMHGYVWEWCADPWNDSHEGAAKDGSVRKEGHNGLRLIRGGSWKDSAETARSSFRYGAPVETRGDHIGFRCVKESLPAVPKKEANP